MDPSTEIRKLTPKDVNRISSILDQNEQWKDLMNIIPKTLTRDNYRCDTSPKNPRKYNSDHFRLLEDESKKSNRKCTEILFDEWGTSGRIRPTLGHLLYLLVKEKLFRAADYIAVDLLHQAKPKRPFNGPGAHISATILQRENGQFQEASEDIRARETATKIVQEIPEIVITDVDREAVLGFTMPLVAEGETFDNENSDELIPVDVEAINTNVSPVVNASCANFAVNTCTSSTDSSNLPNFNKINGSDLDSIESTCTSDSFDIINGISSTANIPNISQLNHSAGNGKENKPTSPPSSEESILLPAISLLGNEYGSDHPTSLPDLSGLGIQSNLGSISVNISSQASSDNSMHSPPCSSPLPALSLDTSLPHFNYFRLLTTTNHFDVGPYGGTGDSGRLLGSGEFGSVFLALGLLDEPVAVKKLFLGNAEVVSVDDEVTNQFRNEVEVLTKYKHENLLDLLGFSCDGCTYCLLYEYIPGGALKQRLQKNENILQWKARLNIALGTARAISYLHTAFDTPLIHRDINSSNILLDSNNNPKLSDFGLIKLIPNQNNAVATTVYGTSAYMAREAFGGDISVKLDTFSFGVVLLELITSLPPIDDNRKGNDLVTHVEETVEDDNILPLVDNRAGSWEEGGLNYAAELFRIAQSCLREKRKRPTMVEVQMALEELTKDLNIN